MAEPQFSVRSAKARELAHRLARNELRIAFGIHKIRTDQRAARLPPTGSSPLAGDPLTEANRE
ncbi:hypothetical protein CKO25_07685 [Thiocapsa imhoffii]|uniref:Uncharacterized protein n=1 Tax=Thiocapsa imhoffii TaxID=382777 RepID=A0A9X0WH00_9GAMM|nr:hypothetical protein [Thiocapsa imhoffii]MBK1644536.1 hypothetical protein [Thiocapsa imhoffii]